MPELLSKAANEVFTLPNAISVAGYVSVKYGINQGVDTPKGIISVGVGRSLDLLDGYVARVTGQTSQFGAMLDATLDKKGMKDIHGALQDKNLIEPSLARTIMAQNFSNAVVSGMDKVLHPKKEMAPSKAGKISMAESGLYLGSAMIAGYLAKEGRHPRLERTVRYLGIGLAADSAYIKGPKALGGYVRRLMNKQ